MSDDIAVIRRAEEQIADAHVRLDLELFASLLHPSYVIVQPGGRVETRAEVLASYRSGTRHWDVARVDDLAIDVHGDTAVVIGRWSARGRNGELAFDYAARFLSVWLRVEGRWLNLTSQSTELT